MQKVATDSATQSKVLLFRLIDDCWMQAGSARMQVTLNNLSSAPLTPIAHPACMFSQARLYLGGQLVETLDENQVLTTLVDRFKPAWRQITDSMENHVINPADGSRLALRANQSRRLAFELGFGILRQPLWLPLHIRASVVPVGCVL